MARTTRRLALPAGVKELRRRIERWRRTRERRTAMPAELWTEAIALARSGRPYAVARATGINFEGLRRRMAESAADGRGAAAPGAFVELSGAEILGATSAAGAVVELSDGDGVRLTVRLAASAEVDVARIVAAFRQRSA
jgi:hypothetical protein